ncbi:hypothetical protein U1Q18_049578 [Sarracenia purpurea var. burkii]
MQVGAKLEDGRKPHVRQPILKSPARSSATQPSSTRKRVAVFDFDDTLCKEIHDWKTHRISEVDFVRKNHPECPTFEATLKQPMVSMSRIITLVYLICEFYSSTYSIEAEEERLGNSSTPDGNYVKDLRVVVRDGESLSDAVLVDDNPGFASLDQHPCLVTLSLFSVDITK